MKTKNIKDKSEHRQHENILFVGIRSVEMIWLISEKNEALGAIFTHETEGLFDVCAIIEGIVIITKSLHLFSDAIMDDSHYDKWTTFLLRYFPKR